MRDCLLDLVQITQVFPRIDLLCTLKVVVGCLQRGEKGWHIALLCMICYIQGDRIMNHRWIRRANLEATQPVIFSPLHAKGLKCLDDKAVNLQLYLLDKFFPALVPLTWRLLRVQMVDFVSSWKPLAAKLLRFTYINATKSHSGR